MTGMVVGLTREKGGGNIWIGLGGTIVNTIE